MKECECGGTGKCQCNDEHTAYACECSNCTCKTEASQTLWQKFKNLLKSFFSK